MTSHWCVAVGLMAGGGTAWWWHWLQCVWQCDWWWQWWLQCVALVVAVCGTGGGTIDNLW